MLRRLSVNRTYLKIDLSRRVGDAQQTREAGIEFAKRAHFRANGRGISFVEDSLHPASTHDPRIRTSQGQTLICLRAPQITAPLLFVYLRLHGKWHSPAPPQYSDVFPNQNTLMIGKIPPLQPCPQHVRPVVLCFIRSAPGNHHFRRSIDNRGTGTARACI